ncbi:hypothetical protein GGQ92_003281 [Gracilibacillus halotolerans]|uniref:Lipoprotein n=1 Tax=Gracilibacillus halotolerans TaxID=74386 RepID=A0A841RJH6_9BACI|nr:hypothetical protein [Gracilibacillus halotolerans]MBB6514430.1 hypothetical protein [Gracilibacillus halotolerans]
MGRKFIGFLIFIIVFLFLVGCSSQSNTIAVAELSEREEAIISMTTDKVFVYEFQTEDGYEKLDIWIDKYESGKLIEDNGTQFGAFISEEGTIILTIVENADTNQNEIQIGILDEKGSVGSTFYDPVEIDFGSSFNGWGPMQDLQQIHDEEIFLGSVVYTNGESIRTPNIAPSNENFSDELAEYELVYIIKAKFY